MRSIPARAGTAGMGWARPAVCALVAATALTGVSAGSAAGAPVPAGTVVVLDGPKDAKAYPYDDPNSEGLHTGVRNTGTTTVDSYTLTLDTTSLKGVADVTGCSEQADNILVCPSGRASLKPGKSDSYPIGLRRAKGATVGASGEIRVTVESKGVRLASRTIKVTVPDAGVVLDRLERTPASEKVKPGASMKVRTGFTDYGATPLDSVGFSVRYEELTPDQEFSNCEYRTRGDSTHGSGLAHCVVEGPVDVNGSYDVDLGSMTVDSAVLSGEIAVHYVPDLRLGRDEDYRRGTGGELRLTPRPASAPPGVPQSSNGDYTPLSVDNTADIQALGTTVRPKRAGGLVTATVGVRNNGPAGMQSWNGSEPGEDLPYRTHVYLPGGTEVATVPEHCHKFTDRHDAVYYDCVMDTKQDSWIAPGRRTNWTFELRVVDPAALKPGRVEVLWSDPRMSNNSAAVVVHAPSRGSVGGGAGGTAGPSGTPGPSDAAQGSGGIGADAGEGELAQTGMDSAVTFAAAVSAPALLLGGGLFLGLRRRAAR
ncbi:LPXTG cell wall anchor domain-containing protein [Streptomyces sp. NPDC005251]|uniref:LPXTG cell wall anchor domain-containing protein n=1 Tax=Streptomyces sp. NPDC005251 TaxID=3157166 RepID=UPI0033BF749F